MKNILHLRSSMGVFGAENVIIEIAKHSYELGYRSILGALKIEKDPYPEFLDVARESGIDIVVFEGKRRIDINCIKKMRNFINSHNIDILHCHGYKEDFYGIFSPSHIKKVATNHLWKRLFFRGKINALMDSFFLRFYSQIVGVSDDILTEMKKYFITDTVKISNGVDIDKFRPKRKRKDLLDTFQIDSDAIILGMISSLTYEKGHVIAINALKNLRKQFPDLKLLIVGDGKIKNELHKYVAESGLSKSVIFSGKQKNIPDLLSILDIFLLPSLVEGLPMALLEAMACGKAVIATRVGENEKVIDDGKNGTLIDPSNQEELESAIVGLISDNLKVAVFGDNARSKIVSKYSSKQMTKKYCELYDSLFINDPTKLRI